MNRISHHIYVYNPTGDLLAVFPDSQFISLHYGFRESAPGVLEIIFPSNVDPDLFGVEYILEVYRSYENGPMALEGDTAFFIRRRNFETSEAHTTVFIVEAISALGLLQRRIVAYYAGTSYTDKIEIPWSNMLREIVYENYGPGAEDTDRNLEPWLTLDAFPSYTPSYLAGPGTTKTMPWRRILTVLQEVIQDLQSSGLYGAFDIIRTGPARFEFRIFAGSRGVDHSEISNAPVVISETRRNLGSPSLSIDWSSEANYVYATGQGTETERVLKTASDTSRISISPFNRQEYQEDARQAEIEASVQAEADSALEAGRPKTYFRGQILETPGCLYGVHWRWGDIVTVEYQKYKFDCHVETVEVKILENGLEEVQGYLRSVDNVE